VRGAVFVGMDQELEVTDLAPLDPGPSDVVVAVGATGVCHSDLSVVNGNRPLAAPTVLGHEAAGTVVAVGSDVRLISPGDRVLAGAARVIAVDPVAWKRDVALTLGATDHVDPAAEDVREAVLALTGGRGVDHAFEATGIPTVVLQALALTRRGGAVLVLGMPRFDSEFAIPALPFFATGKRVVASKYGDAQVRTDIPTIVGLAESGRLDLAALVTRRVALDDVNEALRAMTDGAVIRSVIV